MDEVRPLPIAACEQLLIVETHLPVQSVREDPIVQGEEGATLLLTSRSAWFSVPITQKKLMSLL